MISLPIAIVVTQWVMLFALSGLVIVMYRQLAHLLHLSGSAHDAGGLDVGTVAPTFGYRHPGESTRRIFQPGSRSTVLLFTDPRCGACDAALEAVEGAARGSQSSGLQVLVVSDADDIAVAANEGLSRTSLDIALVDHGVVTTDYRVTGTPLLVGIDSNGAVQSTIAAPDLPAARRLVKDLHRLSVSDDAGEGVEMGSSTTAPHTERK